MSSPASVAEGQGITIPLDHKLVLVPNDHPDGGVVEYPRCAPLGAAACATHCSAGAQLLRCLVVSGAVSICRPAR